MSDKSVNIGIYKLDEKIFKSFVTIFSVIYRTTLDIHRKKSHNHSTTFTFSVFAGKRRLV